MKKIFRFILAFIRLVLVAMLTLLTVIIALPCFYLSGKTRKVSYATARSWGRAALFLLNVHVNIRGQRPKEKVLLMPNHQTFLDIFLVLGYYPSSIVAKKEIGNWPVLRFAIKLGRIILVDRKSLKGTLKAMRSIDKEIKSGGSVILFPEGGTHEGPLTKAFKPGSFKIAEETQTPIIPIAIRYLSRPMAWKNEAFFHHFMQKMGYWRTNVDMWFGPPISGEDCKGLLASTKAAIDEQLLSGAG